MKVKTFVWIIIFSITAVLLSSPATSLAVPDDSVEETDTDSEFTDPSEPGTDSEPDTVPLPSTISESGATPLKDNTEKDFNTAKPVAVSTDKSSDAPIADLSDETSTTPKADSETSASSLDQTEGDWEFRISDELKTATIYHYNGTDTEVTIPDMLGGCQVTALGPAVFTGEFHSTSILGMPYYDNDKTVTSITIPASIFDINMQLFSYMEVLEAVHVNEDNSTYASLDGVLFSKNKNTMKTDTICIYPRGKKDSSYKVPDSVIEVAQDCFSHNNYIQALDLNHTEKMHYRIINFCDSLETLNLGDTCNDINDAVVISCAVLKEITIPNTVMRLCEVYNGTPALSKLTMPDNGQYYYSEDNIIFTKDGTSLVKYAPSRAGTDYTIPDHVTKIEAYAFSGVQCLKTVTVSATVSQIGYYAFHSADLEKVIIHNADCKIIESSQVAQTFHKNVVLCGYNPSTAYDYAVDYGRRFMNIEDGSIETNEITFEGLLKLLPTHTFGEPTYKMSDVVHESDTARDEYTQLKEFTDSLTADCNTTLEKAAAISDWVKNHITYRFGGIAGNTIDSVYSLYYANSPSGNCMAYTRLASYMLYLAGIPTVNAQNTDHEWCMAYIDSKWWIIDSTNAILTDEYSNELYKNPNFFSFSENGNIYAVRNNNGVYLTGFNYSSLNSNTAEEVIIPDYVDRIASSIFDNCKTTLVVTCSNKLKRDIEKSFSCILTEDDTLTARLYHNFTEWSYIGNTHTVKRHCQQCGTKETEERPADTPVWHGETSHTNAIGKIFSLKTTCSSDAKITYISDKPDIVSVSDSGRVTLKSAGTAKITLSTKTTNLYEASQRIITIKVLDLPAPQITSVKTTSIGSSAVQVNITWKKAKNADSYRVCHGYSNSPNYSYTTYKRTGKATQSASITLATHSDSSNKIWVEACKGSVSSTASKYQYYTCAVISLSAKTYAYNGKAKTPAVTVKTGKKVLKKNTDYTVSYSNNKKIGTAKAVISFKGNYRGTRSVSFTIKPPKTTLSSARYSSGGNIMIRWKRNPYAGGCQIQYAANKSFTKNKKTVNISKAKTISKKVPALKKKRPCYVRIRAYKVVSGKKYYSDWSTAKTVK